MTVIAFDITDNTKVMFKGKFENNEEAKAIYEMYGDSCLIEVSSNGFENILWR